MSPIPGTLPASPSQPSPLPPQWTPENEDQVRAYIQAAMDRHGDNVQLAFADLRDQRQQPANYYDTNMAIAADYLRARWDVERHGAVAESASVETYLEMKRTVGVPQEGPGPVSPYSDLEAKYMRLGVHDGANQESFWDELKWAAPVPTPIPGLVVPLGMAKAVWDLF